MSYSISIDDDANLIRVVWSGALVEEEIPIAFNELTNLSGLRLGLNLLADHRELETSPPMERMASAIELLLGLAEKLGPYKYAVVVDKPVSFGTGRAAEGLTFGTDVKVRPFYLLPEAEAWLARPWEED